MHVHTSQHKHTSMQHKKQKAWTTTTGQGLSTLTRLSSTQEKPEPPRTPTTKQDSTKQYRATKKELKTRSRHQHERARRRQDRADATAETTMGQVRRRSGRQCQDRERYSSGRGLQVKAKKGHKPDKRRQQNKEREEGTTNQDATTPEQQSHKRGEKPRRNRPNMGDRSTEMQQDARRRPRRKQT